MCLITHSISYVVSWDRIIVVLSVQHLPWTVSHFSHWYTRHPANDSSCLCWLASFPAVTIGVSAPTFGQHLFMCNYNWNVFRTVTTRGKRLYCPAAGATQDNLHRQACPLVVRTMNTLAFNYAHWQTNTNAKVGLTRTNRKVTGKDVRLSYDIRICTRAVYQSGSV